MVATDWYAHILLEDGAGDDIYNNKTPSYLLP